MWSRSKTETTIWQEQAETDQNQQHVSNSYTEWIKTGQGEDTAGESRIKKRRKSVEARWKKVATLRQTLRHGHNNSRQRAGRVNLSLTPLASCTTLRFSQITTSASQMLFCFIALLWFYETAVTDVIVHQGAKHYTEMITSQIVYCW